MSSYLSVNTRIVSNRLGTILELLFKNQFFLPTSAAGHAAGRTTQHWYLSGYTLNTFLSRSLRGRKKTSEVTLAMTQTSAGKSYLEQMASCVRSWRTPKESTSPFERVEIAAGATFVEGEVLPTESISNIAAWMTRFPHASLAFFGCVDLEGKPSGFPWDRSFRDLQTGQGEGDCFLEISIRPTVVRSTETIVNIFSASEVWLEKDSPVDDSARRGNLHQLSNLVRAVLLLGEDGELQLEGNAFRAAESQLRSGFGLV